MSDSWGVINPKASDNGGIHERWDTPKPKGQEGYEGHAPRQNASRAPGLWQHLKISFKAPRFNAAGQKTENAKMLRVELNDVLIQENIELTGPTRGAMENNEVASGPLRFQGDHGAVAFRNIKLTAFDKSAPELVNLKYTTYKGKYETEPDYKKLPPEAQGTSGTLSSNVSTLANEFLIHYTGTLKVKEPGEYTFNLGTPGGVGQLKLNDQPVFSAAAGRGQRSGKITLSAGDIPLDLYYSKFISYAKPALQLTLSGPGIRQTIISDNNISSNDPVDPILIHAPVNTILRSFTDLDTIRITHAVNVGSAQQLHYTYDMEKGMIVQAWRGDFLDASPMWHSRGDGSTKPLGMLLKFGKPTLAIEKLASAQAAWAYDTAGSNYRPKGYVLDASDRPSFKYFVYGIPVADSITVSDNGQELHRQVTVYGTTDNLFFLLARAKTIQMVSDDLYVLNDKSYYIRLDDASVKPLIREANDGKELIIPVQNKISYSILF